MQFFLKRGWNMIAALRSIADTPLPPSGRLWFTQLDVTNSGSIEAAVDAARPIVVSVNIAGAGMWNALEGSLMNDVRRLFATNTLGTIAITQAVLPQFMARRAGIVVNISSAVTLAPFPLLSLYEASKAAVNAPTETLLVELAQFGMQARVVVPGRVLSTLLQDNSATHGGKGSLSPTRGPVSGVEAAVAQDHPDTRCGRGDLVGGNPSFLPDAPSHWCRCRRDGGGRGEGAAACTPRERRDKAITAAAFDIDDPETWSLSETAWEGGSLRCWNRFFGYRPRLFSLLRSR
jgi:NAD(P)-dependent dehydrogenase (short-subunit alcohol dehydrogenase family)